jgi:hypothetical protein
LYRNVGIQSFLAAFFAAKSASEMPKTGGNAPKQDEKWECGPLAFSCPHSSTQPEIGRIFPADGLNFPHE